MDLPTFNTFDSDMSEFDKEAERERLRKKFAEEEAERESTRHLSELLLKGAKMTDIHCPECGTPLFREDDRTFCPECERTVVTEEEADGDTGEQVASKPPPADPGDTRANLERALERASARAAEAEDPRRARDYLEAARSAIEALNALDERQ